MKKYEKFLKMKFKFENIVTFQYVYFNTHYWKNVFNGLINGFLLLVRGSKIICVTFLKKKYKKFWISFEIL